MCGITGLIRINKKAKEMGFAEYKEITESIRIQNHRGPDDTGLVGVSIENETSEALDHKIVEAGSKYDGFIGFNRLSIKDLSVEGHQPMKSDDNKVVLVFNGEIYNDKELRDSLVAKGYSFKGTSDTEVILKLYLDMGFERMIGLLNGMFAIVITDLRTKKIYMVRDRFGIKPLYYSIKNDRLLFGSELKTLMAYSDIEPVLDMEAYYSRLIFSRPSDAVLIKDVQLMNPGEYAVIDYNTGVSFNKYFDLDQYERDGKYKNIEEAIEATEAVFDDAVGRQLVSDVKVGCQLSGGIDSTIVSYFANKRKTDNLNDAVSIVDSKGVMGEERYIDYVGSKLNLKLHKYTIDEEYFINNYEKMIWHNDAPVYQPFFVSFYKLAQRAKENVTVLLSGEGSDEIAGGYSRFAAGVFQPFISKMNGGKGIVKYDTYGEYAVMTDQTVKNTIGAKNDIVEKLIGKRIDRFNKFEGTDFTKQLKFEIQDRLPEALLRQDKMTMAHSIENRVPFLDNKVVEHIMRMPEDMLLRFASPSPIGLSQNPLNWVQGKYLFKEIVAKHFGNDFAYRTKQIMVLDKRSMITSDSFKEYANDAIFPQMKNRGIIDEKPIRELFENALNITNLEFTYMWRAMCLETWCQLFL